MDALGLQRRHAQGDADRAQYSVADGVVTPASAVQRSDDQLAGAAALLSPPASAPLVPDALLRAIGRLLPRQNIPAKVDGSARYGLGTRLPGMLFAAVRHSLTSGGKVVATPARPAGAIAVLDAVAGASGWGGPLPAGTARGVSIGSAFNTTVAMVVQASGSTLANVRLTRVWLAVDCCLTVNPLNVEAQLMVIWA